jgi:hypothetical protein
MDVQKLTVICVTLNTQGTSLSFDIIHHDQTATCASHDFFPICGEADTPDLHDQLMTPNPTRIEVILQLTPKLS